MINEHITSIICQATGASGLYKIQDIQQLWSGYGQISRYGLHNCPTKTIIIKHVQVPRQSKQHPRGWNSDISHQRKIKSYHIESAWYEKWAQYCDDLCRIPHGILVEVIEDDFLIVLEDLDAKGYPARKNSISLSEMKTCLAWLANFHATFLGKKPSNLWRTGSYWHLETRPDELKVLKDKALKNAAKKIDLALKNTPFQTFVHGDAKLANFCFSQNGKKVAAVDFQYVGGGCGMKDVAYFIGSCLYESDCERLEADLLDEYFIQLKQAISHKNIRVNTQELEQNWRDLYPYAWADFHRFIKGWSPGHWKNNSYSERLSQEVIKKL